MTNTYTSFYQPNCNPYLAGNTLSHAQTFLQDDALATDEHILLASALSNKYVKGAKCLHFDGIYILALITQPFLLKSERDNCLLSLTSVLSQQTNERVIVSFDTDIYRNIRQNMSDEDKQKLVQIVQNRAKSLDNN